jgi:hypothetical protein
MTQFLNQLPKYSIIQLPNADHLTTRSPRFTHSFHPPSIVFTLVMPNAFMSSAARALVDSATQAQ